MTSPNTPQEIDRELDEILDEVIFLQDEDNSTIQDYTQAKLSLQALIDKRVVEELKKLLTREEVEWVVRGELTSHEQFVHSNVIRDRIKALEEGE